MPQRQRGSALWALCTCSIGTTWSDTRFSCAGEVHSNLRYLARPGSSGSFTPTARSSKLQVQLQSFTSAPEEKEPAMSDLSRSMTFNGELGRQVPD